MDSAVHQEPAAGSTRLDSSFVAPPARNLEQYVQVSPPSSSSSSNIDLVSPMSSRSISQPPPLVYPNGVPQSYLPASLPASLYPIHADFTRQGYNGVFPNGSAPHDSYTSHRSSSNKERPAPMPIIVATPIHSPSSSRQEHGWPVLSRIPSRVQTDYSSVATSLLGWGNAHASPVPVQAPTANYWGMGDSVSLSYGTHGIYPGYIDARPSQRSHPPSMVSETSINGSSPTVLEPTPTAPEAVLSKELLVNGEASKLPAPEPVSDADESSTEPKIIQNGHSTDFVGPVRKQVHQDDPRQPQSLRQYSSPYPHYSPQRAQVTPNRHSIGVYGVATPISRTAPAFYVRRRNGVSSADVVPREAPEEGGANAVISRRKPLPKIYECSDPSCRKKFDRPSTLKVHEAIHTGAKDYMCEYCMRAFTVCSNAKRHSRGCKHKALSPPFATCWFICVPPSATLVSVANVHSPKDNAEHAGQPMEPTVQNHSATKSADGTNSTPVPLIAPAPAHAVMTMAQQGVGMSLASTSGSPLVSIHPQPTHHILSYPFRHQQFVVQNPQMTHPSVSLPVPAASTSSSGLQLTVKGQKAPMIIGAMFSAHQNVPNSISHLTLVLLECDVPLPPARAHSKYTHLHQNLIALPSVSAFHGAFGANVTSYVQTTPLTTRVYASLTVRVSKYASAFDTPAVKFPDGNDDGQTQPLEDGELGGTREEENAVTKEGEDRLVEMDRSMRTTRLLPLPNDLFEERDSLIPRSRYCYHPAEYDEMTVLPGPGLAPIPYGMDAGTR